MIITVYVLTTSPAVFALLYFLISSRDYYSIWPSMTSDTSRIVTIFIVNDFVCATLPFALSALYHTFMPHSVGEKIYMQLLRFDVIGVWWCTTLGPMSNFYSGFYCNDGLMVIYLLVYLPFSVYVLYYLMVEDCKRKRVKALTLQFFVRILIHPFRLSPLSFSNPLAVKYYIIMDMISAVGAIINALHIPERWFPGRLDYLFNGHTLMHVAAVVSLIIARQGFLSDMMWLNNFSSCPASNSSVTGFFVDRNILGLGPSSL